MLASFPKRNLYIESVRSKKLFQMGAAHRRMGHLSTVVTVFFLALIRAADSHFPQRFPLRYDFVSLLVMGNPYPPRLNVIGRGGFVFMEMIGKIMRLRKVFTLPAEMLRDQFSDSFLSIRTFVICTASPFLQIIVFPNLKERKKDACAVSKRPSQYWRSPSFRSWLFLIFFRKRSLIFHGIIEICAAICAQKRAQAEKRRER